MKRKSDGAQVRARGKQKDLLFHERPECCRVALGMVAYLLGLEAEATGEDSMAGMMQRPWARLQLKKYYGIDRCGDEGDQDDGKAPHTFIYYS